MSQIILNRRLPLLTIFFIALFAGIYRIVYDIDPSSVITVISLLGLMVSIGCNLLIERILKSKQRDSNGK